MDILKTFEERFLMQQEYLGNEKPVNKITPLVSVCVATYQHAGFISQCLESILGQKTNFPVEIIVGEDGSTDGTGQLCKNLAEKFQDRIRLFLRDRSLSQYYETGRTILRFNSKWNYMSARGKYLAICEGDDYWTDPFKLQKQVDFLEANPGYIMTYHDAKVIGTEGNVIAESKIPDYQRKDYSEQEIIYGNIFISTQSLCFRNVISSFPEELFKVINGDNFLFSLLGWHGRGKYMHDVEPAAYRVHPGGIWSMLTEQDKRITSINTFYWLSVYYLRIGKSEAAMVYYNWMMERMDRLKADIAMEINTRDPQKISLTQKTEAFLIRMIRAFFYFTRKVSRH